MHPFEYARPGSLAEAVALLADRGPEARVLAGGTDLVIRLRDGSLAPRLVVDVKRVPELAAGIHVDGGNLVIGATTVMTDVAADPLVRRHAPALAEAAAVVGSVQIRNRATLAGNVCNASPAADTVPALLVHGALVVAVGPDGTRRILLDDLFVRSGVTTLLRGELVTSIEIPMPADRIASAHERRTRRRGHDLASVTVTCGVDAAGTTRVAYGSVGPRPLLRLDATGTLADRGSSAEARAAIFERMFADASPSVRSMRAGPEYRLAMLRVLGRRALATALDRLAMGEPA
jgi:CO/xanthine dehydrogenase FAD-binding subunit